MKALSLPFAWLTVLLIGGLMLEAESRSEKEAKLQVAALSETLSHRTHERDALAKTVADLSGKLVAITAERDQAQALARQMKPTPASPKVVSKIVTAQRKTIEALDRNANLTIAATDKLDQAQQESETAVKVALHANEATLRTLSEVTRNEKTMLRILVILSICFAALIVIVFMLAKGRKVCPAKTES